MKKALITLALVLATACGGTVATSPTPTATSSSSATATPIPSASASASPSTSKSPIPLPTTAQVAAAGNGVVWMLVADRLFLSTDKGATWTERTWPPQAPNAVIAFVSDKDGWRMESGSPATQCQSQQVGIGNTFDGANTWRGLDGSGIADAQCKGALAFSDTQHGYISAWSPNDRPVIYRTADGGKTWKASAPLPDPAGFTTQPGGVSLRAGPVADFGSVLYVNATDTQQHAYVFKSTDGGATWSVTGGAISPTTVVFVSATRWIQIGAPGESKETTDAGASWHAFTTDYQQAAPVAPQIVFGDAQTGYATVRGGLQRTTDGGLHWTALKTPGT
ncbi:MAG TPA: hypothetical protein VI814_04725 [Candidatus Limnocylindria bacterium]